MKSILTLINDNYVLSIHGDRIYPGAGLVHLDGLPNFICKIIEINRADNFIKYESGGRVWNDWLSILDKKIVACE